MPLMRLYTDRSVFSPPSRCAKAYRLLGDELPLASL
jgi:hypothetical protein